MELTPLTTLYGGSLQILTTPRGAYRVSVDNGEPEEWLRVTAISGTVPKQDQLVPWAAKMAVTHVRQYLEMHDSPFTAEQLDTVLVEAQNAHRLKKEQAADFGTIVHNYAETFGKAKIAGAPLPEIPKDAPEQAINGITAFLDWITTHKVKFYDTERIVASREHKYVGKLDFLAEVDGSFVLGDYKTGSGVYDEAWLQVAGYREALYEEGFATMPKSRLILNFSKDTGEFKAYAEPENRLQEDTDTFLKLIPIRRWLDARRKEYELTKKYV